MKHIRNRLLIAALFLTASASIACADDCGPLLQAASVDVTFTPSGLPMVPVMLNGTPHQFLFGTGGGISSVTQAAATALNLHPLDSRVRLLNTNGNASSQFVSVAVFSIGGLQGKNLGLMISPNSNMGGPNLPVDGELAGDIMERYDTEMDFAGGKLGYFLPDHCDGHVVHWTTSPASVVEYRRGKPGSRNNADTHIRFHVTLDGKDLLAVLSTAIARTQMSAKAADALFNVTENGPGAIPVGTMSDRKVFGHVFKSLSFGDITVTNPHIVVIPDIVGINDPDDSLRTGTHIKKVDDDLEPDIAIGMDIVKKLHIYVATRESKLYITAANTPPG